MIVVVAEELGKAKGWEVDMQVWMTGAGTQQDCCTIDTAGPGRAGAEETHMSDAEAAEVEMPSSLGLAPTIPDSDSAPDSGPCPNQGSYCPSRSLA